MTPAWLRYPLFPLRVVGESRYQDELEAICGRRKLNGEDKTVEAELVLEDENPHDRNAVRVEISGRQVGYLGRDDAPAFRERVQREGLPGPRFPCRAHISGGWDDGSGDRGHYGVRLGVGLYE